jgi:hypothetical protein
MASVTVAPMPVTRGVFRARRPDRHGLLPRRDGEAGR